MLYQPGEIIFGKYRLEEKIGQGAFGEVYRVTHQGLKVSRAIKLLMREADLAEYAQRFEMEAGLGARLDHPHLVRVYDFEQNDQALALVMEYCPGGSLARRLKTTRQENSPLPVDECLRIAREIALGLAAIHAQDIVHRDLKPENILFDAQDRAKVADLGLAQVKGGLSMRSQLSQAAPHPGTPGYKSPEQESSPEYLRPAADVYALGVILFEMLAGRSYANLRPGTSAGGLRPDIPTWLDELLLSMLSADPQQRPWDGGAAASLLQPPPAPAQTAPGAQTPARNQANSEKNIPSTPSPPLNGAPPMTGSSPHGSSDSIPSLQRTLQKARQALEILEQQAASYTELTIPTHLKIDLESKRQEIERLEAALGHSVFTEGHLSPQPAHFYPPSPTPESGANTSILAILAILAILSILVILALVIVGAMTMR